VLRESHYDKLLSVYHQAASKMITSLDSNPDVVHPMAGFQAELNQFARFGVGMNIEAIPFSLMDDDKTAVLDSRYCGCGKNLGFEKFKRPGRTAAVGRYIRVCQKVWIFGVVDGLQHVLCSKIFSF
jgi:hypothetical protein